MEKEMDREILNRKHYTGLCSIQAKILKVEIQWNRDNNWSYEWSIRWYYEGQF